MSREPEEKNRSEMITHTRGKKGRYGQGTIASREKSGLIQEGTTLVLKKHILPHNRKALKGKGRGLRTV